MYEYEKIQDEFNRILAEDCNTELWGMSTIARDELMYVGVNPDSGRNFFGMEYFKLFNSPSYTTSTKEARIKFRTPKYVKHRDNKENWVLNAKEKSHLMNLLIQPSKYEDDCTVWQYGIMQFNLEAYDVSHKETRQITQKYLDTLSDDDVRKKYLPFDLKTPDYSNLSD